MRLLPLVVLMLVTSMAALADPAAAPPPVTHPTATGAPHICLEYYPPLAMRIGVEGKATLRFVITEQGTVRDAVVIASSGNDMLDQASLQCVSGWSYQPATRDGQAIAVSWKVAIDWLLHDTFEAPVDPAPQKGRWVEAVPADGEDHGCQFSLNPGTYPHGAPNTVQPTGPSVLAFTITPDGTTGDIAITKSSGNAAYDNEALKCVATWHYTPARHNGTPVSVRWLATLPWRSAPSDGTPQRSGTSPVELGGPHQCLPFLHISYPSGFSGTTTLEFSISEKGTVESVRVAKSSGNAQLDYAAVLCAPTWTYAPATLNGQPVRIGWRAAVNWTTP